ncbi:glutathione S-transferase A-like isoform X2 [Narcine bancroftii]|uniref:glutathione S-transferase A-like isoform X2 n=1 Tax=Narcine bancroftii TaxID=1343680 RepID=UPI003831C715
MAEEEKPQTMLYWGSGSPQCWRLQIALLEKKQDNVPQKLVSFNKGEHKSPQVLALNARGQVPAFILEGVSINDSVAACFYLESQFKYQGTQLIPDEPAKQAMVYQKTFEALFMYQKMEDYLFYDWRIPKLEQRNTAQERNIMSLREELKLWEMYLEKMTRHKYLTGRIFTLADVVMFTNIAFCFRFGELQTIEAVEMLVTNPEFTRVGQARSTLSIV